MSRIAATGNRRFNITNRRKFAIDKATWDNWHIGCCVSLRYDLEEDRSVEHRGYAARDPVSWAWLAIQCCISGCRIQERGGVRLLSLNAALANARVHTVSYAPRSAKLAGVPWAAASNILSHCLFGRDIEPNLIDYIPLSRFDPGAVDSRWWRGPSVR